MKGHCVVTTVMLRAVLHPLVIKQTHVRQLYVFARTCNSSIHLPTDNTKTELPCAGLHPSRSKMQVQSPEQAFNQSRDMLFNLTGRTTPDFVMIASCAWYAHFLYTRCCWTYWQRYYPMWRAQTPPGEPLSPQNDGLNSCTPQMSPDSTLRSAAHVASIAELQIGELRDYTHHAAWRAACILNMRSRDEVPTFMFSRTARHRRARPGALAADRLMSLCAKDFCTSGTKRFRCTFLASEHALLTNVCGRPKSVGRSDKYDYAAAPNPVAGLHGRDVTHWMHNQTFWPKRGGPENGASPYLGQQRLGQYVEDLEGYIAMVEDGFSDGTGTEMCIDKQTQDD